MVEVVVAQVVFDGQVLEGKRVVCLHEVNLRSQGSFQLIFSQDQRFPEVDLVDYSTAPECS